jgi:methionyl-tRNA formyltransferase
MGTPDFAVASLKHLIEQGHNIVAVITAPDKPAGRGKKILPSPVKKYAESAGLKILQPTNLKEQKFLTDLQALQADIQVVVAFRMLPESVWSMPRLGTINLHASLLPDYRGAAPINWAIINGETETGLTTFFIEKDIDTGKIIFSERVPIDPNMTAGELHNILMETGARLLDKTLLSIKAGNYPAIPQKELMPEKEWHAAPKIFTEDCFINWKKPLKDIHNHIRGLSPYPAARTCISDGSEEVLIKIFKTSFKENNNPVTQAELNTDGKTFINIELPDGTLHIHELQMEGRKRMSTIEFLRGFKDLNSYKVNIS